MLHIHPSSSRRNDSISTMSQANTKTHRIFEATQHGEFKTLPDLRGLGQRHCVGSCAIVESLGEKLPGGSNSEDGNHDLV
jgi:hypothetical protein